MFFGFNYFICYLGMKLIFILDRDVKIFSFVLFFFWVKGDFEYSLWLEFLGSVDLIVVEDGVNCEGEKTVRKFCSKL